MEPNQSQPPLRPIKNSAGQVITKVETHFPVGAGLLIIRRSSEHFEIQLVNVDKTDAFAPVCKADQAFGDRSAKSQVDQFGPIARERNCHFFSALKSCFQTCKGFPELLRRFFRMIGSLRDKSRHTRQWGVHNTRCSRIEEIFNSGGSPK